ncbi:outer membrane protein assembly factor BamB family protein [Tautonia marina]|uniref:outer membrane protein assembly factor BamB family protein n=1 Tax=Tautonia marina TaxID=2653855 RepID=UPI0012606854|nr:PQQ-binding-like beta-propeller repeat protein [Tautonia marina]
MPRLIHHHGRWLVASLLFIVGVPSVCLANDWPMWRHDAGRSATTTAGLPDDLTLSWSRELGPPAPAWPPEQDYHGKLEFDRTYQPIVLGQRIIVPSMASDSVTAYDTRTGQELWRFYADGPVRFAPVGHNGRVSFVSDDGHLYCVSADDGSLIWKVRGGPDQRAILGNERLISSWPARGAPVLSDDGLIYFGAGIWPFMGIFLHAVDAASGEIVWTNSGTGAIYNLHQHGGADAFGGIAPQGYMAISGDHLVVGGGLTVPALFNRKTGEFLAFEQSHAAVGKGTGGFDLAALGDYYFNAGLLFHTEDGMPRLSIGTGLPLLGDNEITIVTQGELIRFSTDMTTVEVQTTDRRGKPVTQQKHSLAELGRAKLPVAVDRLLLQAESRIVVLTQDGTIALLDWTDTANPLSLVSEHTISGTVDHVLAADNRLFVVTEEGWLHSLSADTQDAKPQQHRLASTPAPEQDSPAARRAGTLLDQTGKRDGIALVWGIDDGMLVEALIAQSNLRIIAVDADPARVSSLRRRLDDARVYGHRAHVLNAPPHEFPFPPYLAELVVSERLDGSIWSPEANPDQSIAFLQRLFHTLRPYGGVAALPLAPETHSRLAEHVSTAELANASVESFGAFVTLTRVGPLPGAGQWTHQYGSSANTVDSGDKLVKAPLGMLWFGGPTNFDALPRHGQGPIPQVAGGRLIIEGVNSISARCVYTGRTLWRHEFPDIGFPYKANNHTFSGTVYINNQPGANFIGSNYVSLPDAIYVVYKNECHRLDPTNGETVATFRLPSSSDDDTPDGWGYIGVTGDYLVAGASPQIFDQNARLGEKNWNATSSQRVVVMNRHSGKVLWSRTATYGFRHNAIVPVGEMVFLIDRLSDGALDLLARRGRKSNDLPVLSAHNLATGEELWSSAESIFGTWLGYSEAHDILIQGGRTGGREHLPDEPSERIVAFRGTTGKILWDNPIRYTGPLVIRGNQIISSGRNDGAVDLLTGEIQTRFHPITGAELPWTHTRTYGCGTVLACENLLTFRSGAAGFFDLKNDGGTGNFGGFKAGCTPNLVPADGILNAPDYTRTCSCSYQNQTSLAMIHMPDVETWTYSTVPAPREDEDVQRIGINFNAPGDRLAESGTLWVDYPSIAGPSPDIPVKLVAGEMTDTFRNHSALLASTDGTSALAGQTLPWVAASGFQGNVSLELTLRTGDDLPESSYTVRLHFLEPDDVAPGRRVFDVALQGETRESGLDVVATAGGRLRPLVREYPNITVTDVLRLDLKGTDGSLPPVLSGIEILK